MVVQVSANRSSASEPALPVLRAWDLPNLVLGFMTREGGVSHGLYRSFNLAYWVGDDPGSVRTNWERWHAAYPGLRPIRLQQVHGSLVHRVAMADDGTVRIGDGMVTAAPGIALAIFTADCVPVLMVEPDSGVLGALHAGWRGTLAGIVQEGVNAMAMLGARVDRIRAALGPAIGSCCFEVDAALAARFIAKIPTAAAFCHAGRSGKKHLDLRAIVRSQLQLAGADAGEIVETGPCTRCNSERFFSRRAAGGAATGLQMSFIGFRDYVP